MDKLKNFQDRVLFSQLDDKIKNINIESEFRILKRITHTNFHVQKLIETTEDIHDKNRYDIYLPFNHTAVGCECEEPLD